MLTPTPDCVSPAKRCSFPCNFPSSQMKAQARSAAIPAQAPAGWPHASQDGDFLHPQLLGTNRVGFLTSVFIATYSREALRWLILRKAATFRVEGRRPEANRPCGSAQSSPVREQGAGTPRARFPQPPGRSGSPGGPRRRLPAPEPPRYPRPGPAAHKMAAGR